MFDTAWTRHDAVEPPERLDGVAQLQAVLRQAQDERGQG